MADLEFGDVVTLVTFVAHLCGSILGIIALYGLIKHRNKISAFVRLIAHNVTTERVKRIEGTLGELDSLNYDVKEQRRSIVNLLGQLTGMVRLLGTRHEGFKQFHAELFGIVENPQNLSEATKRRFSEELHALLDEHSLTATLNLMEEPNGPKNH